MKAPGYRLQPTTKDFIFYFCLWEDQVPQAYRYDRASKTTIQRKRKPISSVEIVETKISTEMGVFDIEIKIKFFIFAATCD